MAQLNLILRAFNGSGSLAARFRFVRQAVFAMALSAVLWSAEAGAQAIPPSCPNNLGTVSIIDHDFTVSFCELCDVGTVRLDIENPYRRVDDADFSDIVIRENLAASGLTYVPGSTRFTANNVAPPPVVQPVVSGPNGSVLTWTLSNQFELEGRPNGGGGGGGSIRSLTVEFDVRRASAVGEEGLVLANRTIEAEVEFTPSCETSYRHTSTTESRGSPCRRRLSTQSLRHRYPVSSRH